MNVPTLERSPMAALNVKRHLTIVILVRSMREPTLKRSHLPAPNVKRHFKSGDSLKIHEMIHTEKSSKNFFNGNRKNLPFPVFLFIILTTQF